MGESLVRMCKNYVKSPSGADVIHAGASLRSDSVLVIDDTHFDEILDESIIEVWNIAREIEGLL